MGWRDYAREVQGRRDVRDERDNSPVAPPSGSIVPSVPEAVAQSRLREWHARLSSMDEFTSPPGWTLNQWLKTLDASYWLYENFASQAVRDGWSALDLFGVLPQKPGWGGLADRLGDARNLKMAEGRASWSSFGVRQSFGRGCGEDLAGSGLIEAWGLQP